jgi:hypothetical protein
MIDVLRNALDPVAAHYKVHMSILSDLDKAIYLAHSTLPKLASFEMRALAAKDHDEDLTLDTAYYGDYAALSFEPSSNESGRNSRMDDYVDQVGMSLDQEFALAGLYPSSLGGAVTNIVSSLQAEMTPASVSLVVEAMKAAAVEAPAALKELTAEEFTNSVQALVFTSASRTRAPVGRDVEMSYAMPVGVDEHSLSFFNDSANGFVEDDEVVGGVFTEELPMANIAVINAPAAASSAVVSNIATNAVAAAQVTMAAVMGQAPAPLAARALFAPAAPVLAPVAPAAHMVVAAPAPVLAPVVAMTAAALADPVVRVDTIRALVEAGILAAPEPEAHNIDEIIYAAKSLSRHTSKGQLDDSAVDLSDHGPLFSPSKSDAALSDEGFESHGRPSLEPGSPATEAKKSAYLASILDGEAYAALASNVNINHNPYLGDEHKLDLDVTKQDLAVRRSLYEARAVAHDGTALDLTKSNGHDVMNSYLAALRRHLQANIVIA